MPSEPPRDEIPETWITLQVSGTVRVLQIDWLGKDCNTKGKIARSVQVYITETVDMGGIDATRLEVHV